MATLQDFYPWVQVDCPGVPAPLLNDAIRKGAREFCKLTNCLESTVAVTTVVGQKDYAPTLPTGTEIITAPVFKRSATEFINPQSQPYIDAQPSASGRPTMFCVIEELPLELRFYPTPAEVEALSVVVSLMPTDDATTLDDKLLHWYQEGVTSYAKYHLMSQPKKAWTDAETAAFEFRRFNARVGDTKIRRSQWRADLPSMVQMHPLA